MLHSIEVTRGGTVTFTGLSTGVPAASSTEIGVLLGETQCTLLYTLLQSSGPVPKSVQWNVSGLPRALFAEHLDIKDDAFDLARRTTIDDLSMFGDVDNWLRPVEGVAAGSANYSDQWSYFMFWVNDIRFADRKHEGNQITTGERENRRFKRNKDGP
jgi:hypothetical protein